MPITRRQFIFGSVAIAGGFTYSRYIEPSRLVLERIKVELPSRLLSQPIKILQLTDLHYSSVVSLKFIEKAFDLGMSASPDLVCFTGDFVTSNDLLKVDALKPLLLDIGKSVPTFASLGNHDGGSWSATRGGFSSQDNLTKLLEDSQIHVLRNSSSVGEIGAQKFKIVGLEDLWSGAPDVAKAFATNTEIEVPTVVLSHNPDSKDLLSESKWHLALCGHTHGGQVVIPFVGAPIVPVRDKAFTAGLNDWRGRKIYTSRGIGNLYGIRFNCPPEITLIELLPSV